jgi:twitching motility protein PilT
MSIVPSLLQAIVHVDGEALVMHAGDKPYVVSPTGQVDLASRGLTLDAVNGIVSQLLPADFRNALDEFGAVQYELAASQQFPGEHFTVVAARGGDDVWVEVRRRRVPDDDVPAELFAPAPAVTAVDHAVPEKIAPPKAVVADEDLVLPDAAQLWPRGSGDADLEGAEHEIDLDEPIAVGPKTADAPERPSLSVSEPPHATPPPVAAAPLSSPRRDAVKSPPPVVKAPPPSPAAASRPVVTVTVPPQPARVDVAAPPAARVAAAPPAPPPRPIAAVPPPPSVVEPRPVAAETAPAIGVRPATPTPVSAASASERTTSTRSTPPQPAVVLPISRNPIRTDVPPTIGIDPTMSGLDRLLRLAAARGASTLYLSSDTRPSVRVDGEIQVLEGEPELTARDVESLLLTLMPERNHEALRTGATTEWICDIEDVGRVRCMSFRDHLGPGGVFRLMPTRSISAEHLGLPRPVQALAIEPEGLVLVAGPRSSGKRTLMAAYVDLINKTRRDHVVTIEREVNIVHERGSSFISQREVRGNDDQVLAAARAALREDPDVLVIEDLRTGGLMNVALEAAASGHLVVGGFSAHTATAAIDRIIDLYAPEYRHQVQFALADNLRGVVVQVLLRKVGGGRIAAREVLLNTPAVSSVLAEGKTSQLPMAIEGGRRYGMVPMNDSLVALVQSGAVDSREAYRHSSDRPGFLALLKRQGLDTSFAERLA